MGVTQRINHSNNSSRTAMEILNLEELLQPISEAAPSGSDQSATPQYLQAIEAMREDDPTISRQPWEEVKAAEWGKAERLCEELLSKKTKDLTVAFWYTDALLRTHGLAGLSEGLQLVSGIIDQFWDTFHPQLSEPNDLYRRMNVVMKFMNKFNEKLGLIPITKPSAGDSKPYTWANYNEASYVDKLPANDQKAAVENGRATTALFAASLKSTPNDFILQLNDATEQLSDIVKNMESVLVEHCEALRESLDEKSDADVSFSVVHESLDIFLQFSQRQIKERGLRKPEPAKQVTAQNADDSRNGVQSSGGISGGYAMGPGM
ncbi:MAG: type VI secretion system protein TssA, partial [Candidatus Kapabacteria bacterium]|nr:type VI secretion system protein TssA [Candidatus Kapabacteria bacterium]